MAPCGALTEPLKKEPKGTQVRTSRESHSVEVEKKYRLRAGDVSRIARLAAAADPVIEVDEVFLLESTGWESFIPGQPVIRLRSTAERVVLTVKRSLPGPGLAAWESEVAVDDAHAARQLLENMGAQRVTRVAKTRRVGSYRGVKILIDEVEGLGHFAEVEVLSRSAGEASKALRLIDQVACALGLSREAAVMERYDTLLQRAGL